MSEAPTIASRVEAFLEEPEVKRAQVIEACVCDLVHFRLLHPRHVFELVERRLRLREPETFAGFMEARYDVERHQRGASIHDKVGSSCVKHPEWLDHRQVIYSVELEVWMDLSYPNPLGLELYSACQRLGKTVFVPRQGPFSPLFHALLLQKNGYEKLAATRPEAGVMPVYIGPQVSVPQGARHLNPPVPEARLPAIADGESLAEQLLYGLFLKDRASSGLKHPEAADFWVRRAGYELVGPTLLLLLQELDAYPSPVAFKGLGSGFLTTLGETLQASWPGFPDVTTPDKVEFPLGLLHESRSSRNLLPAADNSEPAFLEAEDFEPAALLLPAVEAFLRASMRGRRAAGLQAAAADCVREFARATRGLRVRIPRQAVLNAWREALLQPEPGFLAVFTGKDMVPGFRRSRLPGSHVRNLRSGPWPTASHLTANAACRLWARLAARPSLREIEAARARS